MEEYYNKLIIALLRKAYFPTKTLANNLDTETNYHRFLFKTSGGGTSAKESYLEDKGALEYEQKQTYGGEGFQNVDILKEHTLLIALSKTFIVTF